MALNADAVGAILGKQNVIFLSSPPTKSMVRGGGEGLSDIDFVF